MTSTTTRLMARDNDNDGAAEESQSAHPLPEVCDSACNAGILVFFQVQHTTVRRGAKRRVEGEVVPDVGPTLSLRNT